MFLKKYIANHISPNKSGSFEVKIQDRLEGWKVKSQQFLQAAVCGLLSDSLNLQQLQGCCTVADLEL